MTETDTAMLPADRFDADSINAVYRAMLTRRDVRGEFLSDPIPDDILSRILVAAHHAPSVGYMQPWTFTVIREPSVKKKVHASFETAHAEAALMFPEENRAFYRSLKLEGILEAPVNICVTCDRKRAGDVVIGRTHIPAMDLYSAVCAVQNLWLAARAEGIGVGWVSILKQKELRQALDIPGHIIPVAYLCLGKVSAFHEKPELEKAGWRPRLPLEELVRFDGWNGTREQDPLLDNIRRDQAAVRNGNFSAG